VLLQKWLYIRFVLAALLVDDVDLFLMAQREVLVSKKN
jgi:hypothetical protein